MKKIKSYTGIWNVEKVLYAINDFNLPFPVTFTQITWFVITEFLIILFRDIPPLSMIEGAFLKYLGIPVALTWFMSMKHLYSDVNINALPDVDFSVVTENPHIMKCVDLINKAIKEQRTIKFIYTNSAGNTKEVFLNPLHTYYKWYSWYAFGYDTSKKDYHLFKVVRMKNISLTKELFQTEDNIANLLSDFEKRRNQTNITVTLSYKQEIDTLVNEYFKGKIIETVNDCFIREIEIKENDFMIFSILLGLCDKVKILSPQKYKEKVLIHIGKIKKNFI